MGKKIYRYRIVSDFSIEELIYDKIVGTKNYLLNDYFDCKYYYSKKEAEEFVDKYSVDLDNKIAELSLYKTTNQKLHFLVNYFQHYFSSHFFTACFSEKNNSEVMWNVYSDNGRGFIIEYDYDEIKKQTNDTMLLEKIKYSNIRTNNTNLLVNVLKTIINEEKYYTSIPFCEYKFILDDAKNIIFEKSDDWKYEKEVRLTMLEGLKNENKDHEPIISNILPTAIYIGKNCSKKDRLLLYQICKIKGIDVYNIKYSNEKQSFKIYYEKVDNIEMKRVTDDLCFSLTDVYRKELMNNVNDKTF